MISFSKPASGILLRRVLTYSNCWFRHGAKNLKGFSTLQANRYVRMENSELDTLAVKYPTPGQGHKFDMHIFGLIYTTKDINDLQKCIWDATSFLPRQPAQHLPKHSPLADLSSIASKMAVTLQDGSTPGFLAKNKLRSTVASTLNVSHFNATMSLLKAFQEENDHSRKEELGQQISNVAFWTQWLIRGVLFEGKLHEERFCEEAVRAPLSQIAFAANAALGRHQIEFVYDDYTLKAATFPEDLDRIDYDNLESIKDAVARIDTPVGFLAMKGSSPEHNFRHIHSLMENQMKMAFEGNESVLAGDVSGWTKIVEAARRANKVFHTMLNNTPPQSYPLIRLPIKGVRGACGSVYHPHGVFYEGVGSDKYLHTDGTQLNGVYVDNEFGQTGANSSMYKWFDLFCGVAKARHAYEVDAISLSKMSDVFDGKIDPGQLGDNPIDSMQRAFDLFTRPPLHMKILIDTDDRLRLSGILESTDPSVLLQRLRLAYWVADHRMTHGRYVTACIYQTKPVGGQSRSAGTGGSTPPFLKLFLDQTIHPARLLIIQLLLQQGDLSQSEREEVKWISNKFDEFEASMERVKSLGLKLEFDEKQISRLANSSE